MEHVHHQPQMFEPESEEEQRKINISPACCAKYVLIAFQNWEKIHAGHAISAILLSKSTQRFVQVTFICYAIAIVGFFCKLVHTGGESY